MFVIHEGECEVYYTNERVAELKPGASFGEIALMYACPRTATIKVSQDFIQIIFDVFALDKNPVRLVGTRQDLVPPYSHGGEYSPP